MLFQEFKEIAEAGKGMIVMSFGSVAHAELMPEHWKTAFLNAFAHFPEYEFVIRYASDDLKGMCTTDLRGPAGSTMK